VKGSRGSKEWEKGSLDERTLSQWKLTAPLRSASDSKRTGRRKIALLYHPKNGEEKNSEGKTKGEGERDTAGTISGARSGQQSVLAQPRNRKHHDTRRLQSPRRVNERERIGGGGCSSDCHGMGGQRGRHAFGSYLHARPETIAAGGERGKLDWRPRAPSRGITRCFAPELGGKGEEKTTKPPGEGGQN